MAAKAAGKIVEALFRVRGFILITLAVSAALAIVRLWHSQLPWPDLALPICAVFAGTTAIGFSHLRHFWLALLAVLAPLPGLLIAIASSGTVAGAVVGYALGLVIALFAADEFIARVAQGAQPIAGSLESLQETISVAGAIAFVGLVLLALRWWPGGAEWSESNAAASLLSAALIVPLASSSLKIGESTIASFNRRGEMQARLWTPLLPVAHPRWGASIAGVAVVFCAIGYFGAIALPREVLGAICLFLTATVCISLFIMRDWRWACATALSLVPALLGALWAMARLHEAFGEPSLIRFMIVLATGLALVLFVAVQAVRYSRAGDAATVAFARAMERKGSIVAVAACAAILTIAIGAPHPTELIVLIGLCALAAILVQPAITISIETLLPRRETIAARYRVR